MRRSVIFHRASVGLAGLLLAAGTGTASMRGGNGGVTWTCAYDANGNRTSRTGIGESATYTYDRAPRQLAGAEIDSRRLPAGRDERGARASQMSALNP